ncbi:hypothetical protein TNCV_683571 [Trichonephila clavipes]|nr:hypothetical protein TNCV_683571 [Trichonephila clavipes]
MTVPGFCYNGKLTIKVLSKAKINSFLYQQNILEPIFEEKFLSCMKKDVNKVELHMDKASNHACESTAAYLAKKESETEIKCIPFDEIPVK